MRKFLLLLLLSQVALAEPMLGTYSIVARDPQTGRLGVAVESHWFNVRANVPWARPGVGAVATQAATNSAFGYRGLELMGQGETPRAALTKLLTEDSGAARRQVGYVDAQGRTASWTGHLCIPAAQSIEGEQFVVQSNLMDKDTVSQAMADAYRRSTGPLEFRLLAALKAAQAEGGDLRGMQSAAMVVVAAKDTGNPVADTIVDLSVEDHAEPLEELERLLNLHQDYASYNAMIKAVDDHNPAALEPLLARLSPDNQELRFWVALELYRHGARHRALALFQPVFQANDAWRQLLPRLVPAELLTKEQVKAIQEALPR